MKPTPIATTLLLAATSLAMPVGDKQLAPKAEGWNAAAWSNFVKSYVVFDEDNTDVSKRDNWNAAAWSHFVKSYVVFDGEEEDLSKRNTNWNAAAWSNFVKSYVDGAEDV